MFSHFSAQSALALSAIQSGVINVVLVWLLVTCFVTDWREGKIFNKVTFPSMAAGLVLCGAFGLVNGKGAVGFQWALLGWAVGMGIQWVPFMLGFAKAGDVKLLAAVGALKGWAFCVCGFLYGAVAFALLMPFLAKKGELHGVAQTIKNYARAAAVTQSAPQAPEPTVRRHLPWGPGLVVGFFIALALELFTGRPFWFF